MSNNKTAGLSAPLHKVEEEEGCQSPTEWHPTPVHVCTWKKGRIGSLVLFSSQMRPGSHSGHETVVREPGDDVKKILVSAMSSSVSETYCASSVSSSHTVSVSVLQSGHEVQRGTGLITAPSGLEHSTSGFSAFSPPWYLGVMGWNTRWCTGYCKYVQAHHKVGGILFEMNSFWHLKSLDLFKKRVCGAAVCHGDVCFDSRKTTQNFPLLFN